MVSVCAEAAPAASASPAAMAVPRRKASVGACLIPLPIAEVLPAVRPPIRFQFGTCPADDDRYTRASQVRYGTRRAASEPWTSDDRKAASLRRRWRGNGRRGAGHRRRPPRGGCRRRPRHRADAARQALGQPVLAGLPPQLPRPALQYAALRLGEPRAWPEP